MVWVAFAVMTAAVALGLVWPLSARRAARGVQAADLAFYHSQLAELDDDVRRGLIAPGEVEATRTEIGRRLLSATRTVERPAGRAAPGLRARRVVAVAAALVFVPGFAVLLYLRIGAPDQPDLPIASRDTGGGFELAAAIPKIEAHLAADPGDGRGFALVAPIYMRLGRFDDAVQAYTAALRLLGETAERRAALGQALVAAADGVVTADARAAFQRAVAEDPKLPQARFALAMAAEQDGDKDRARTLWQALLADSGPEAPWLDAVRGHLAALDGTAAPPPDGVPSGPAAAGIAALPPEQQQAAIRGMVDSLAARLAQNGHDPEGWLRLIRAYTVLGAQEKAQTALLDARKGLDGDAAALARVDDLARQLGLKG